MLDDNLNRGKLAKMIGAARFETAEELMNELEEPIQKNFFIDEERTAQKVHEDAKRADLHILDAISRLEILIVIGFKTVKDSPKLSDEDIQAFHKECKKLKSLYGVLLTETETHFYEYKKEGPAEIKEIQPFNYIDAEFEDHMTPQKYQDCRWAPSAADQAAPHV